MKKMLLFVAAMFTAATSFAQSGIEVAEPAWTKTITDAVDEASDVNVYAPVVITDQGQIIKTGTFTQAFSFARKSLEPIAKSAYIVKYDKDGYELWGNALQGAATITAITADVAGNIFVAGVFADKVIITSTDGETVEINGMENMIDQISGFIAAYDKDGKLLAYKTVIPEVKEFGTSDEKEENNEEGEGGEEEFGPYYDKDSQFWINKIAVSGDKVYFTVKYVGDCTLDDVKLEGKIRDALGDGSFYIDLYSFAVIELDKNLSNARLLADLYASESTLMDFSDMQPRDMRFAVDGDNVFVAWTGTGDITMKIGNESMDYSFEYGYLDQEHPFVVANATTKQAAVFHAPASEQTALFRKFADMQVVGEKLYIAGTYIDALPFDNTKTSTSSCDAFVAVLNTSDLSLECAETSGLDENAEGGNKNNEKVTAMIVDGSDVNLLIDVVEETTKTTTVVGTYGFVYYSADDARNIRALPVSYHVSAVSVGTAGTAINADEGTESKVMFFTDEFFTLGIETIDNEQKDIKNGAVYNLQGQRVKKATKGVFIQNGKKVVISR